MLRISQHSGTRSCWWSCWRQWLSGWWSLGQNNGHGHWSWWSGLWQNYDKAIQVSGWMTMMMFTRVTRAQQPGWSVFATLFLIILGVNSNSATTNRRERNDVDTLVQPAWLWYSHSLFEVRFRKETETCLGHVGFFHFFIAIWSVFFSLKAVLLGKQWILVNFPKMKGQV